MNKKTTKSRKKNSRVNALRVDVKSINDMLSTELDVNLESYGYVTIKRIAARDDGEPTIHYVKAINKNGEKVYIMVDLDKVFEAQPSDHLMKFDTLSGQLPLSVKNGAIKASSLETIGVAIECEHGDLTIVYREPNKIHPIEIHYYNHEFEYSENCILSFPVVRLSEIYIDNDTVLNNSSIVTGRLRNNIHDILIEDINEFGEQLNELSAAFMNFHELHTKICNQINDNFEYYRDLNTYYNQVDPIDQAEQEQHQEAYEEVVNRNNGVNFLLTTLNQVASKRHLIEECTRDIELINHHLEHL